MTGKGYLDRLCPDESGVLNVGVPFCNLAFLGVGSIAQNA